MLDKTETGESEGAPEAMQLVQLAENQHQKDDFDLQAVDDLM